jgi:hypothetical protein
MTREIVMLKSLMNIEFIEFQQQRFEREGE